MTKKVYARVLTETTRVVPSDRDLAIERGKPTQEFLTLAEKLSRSTIYCRFWYVPELKTVYPYHDSMRRVDKYFPYAEKGPLLVDEPSNETEYDECLKKRAAIKKANSTYRYVVLEKDTDFVSALQQLGET